MCAFVSVHALNSHLSVSAIKAYYLERVLVWRLFIFRFVVQENPSKYAVGEILTRAVKKWGAVSVFHGDQTKHLQWWHKQPPPHNPRPTPAKDKKKCFKLVLVLGNSDAALTVAKKKQTRKRIVWEEEQKSQYFLWRNRCDETAFAAYFLLLKMFVFSEFKSLLNCSSTCFLNFILHKVYLIVNLTTNIKSDWVTVWTVINKYCYAVKWLK